MRLGRCGDRQPLLSNWRRHRLQLQHEDFGDLLEDPVTG